MFRIVQPDYTLLLEDGRLPSILDTFAKYATLYEEIDHDTPADIANWCFIAVSRNDEMPFLVLTIRYSPHGAGFSPGILLVPETNTLFIGAGERLLAYDLSVPKKLWQDTIHAGFWGWSRHDDVIIASAELEIAAWSADARKKLWTHPTDPPWTYAVTNHTLSLTWDGFQTHFNLHQGPP